MGFRHAGLQLDKLKATASDIAKAINATLLDPKYSRNAKKCADDMLKESSAFLQTLTKKPKDKLSVGVEKAAQVITKAMASAPTSPRPPQAKPSTCVACTVQ